MAGDGRKRTKTPPTPKPPKPRKIRNRTPTIGRYDYSPTYDIEGFNRSLNGTSIWQNDPDEPFDDIFIGREESYEYFDQNDEYCVESTLLTTPKANVAVLNANDDLSFTVKINNIAAFTCRPRKTTSEQFFCRGLPFHLIVENQSRRLNMSVFVCRAGTDNELYDSGLDIVASCEISILDQIDGTHKNKRNFINCFRATNDWGFKNWLTADQAQQLQADGAGILHNNSMIICVGLKAEPPHCNSISSKLITGHVGIRNQGATCYMNSLLQVLYFINKFRTACYRIPTELDDKSSEALALQKVFYNLEFSDSAVCTKNLTESFQWTSVDVLMQHDVQEMMRWLIDRIEIRMKNTLLEPILPSLFQGKFLSYVKCRDIEFSSQREEVFYDIQLSLENSSNLYESFKRYVSPEMMDDDNKYHAGDHGLQAAEKGTLFMSLPPVMFLHLLRFQFDEASSQVMKNNNFFEFYQNINLTDFVQKDETANWNYTLFAVLSHSGGGSHGHYVAYINPSLDGEWFKFDDETISLVSTFDAIDSNFGSQSYVDEWTKSIQLNAYMLVYVRDSMAADVFEPTDEKYISDELKSASLSDPSERVQHLKSCIYTSNVYVLLDTLLESDISFSLKKLVKIPKFPVSRNSSTNDFKKELLSTFKLSGIDQIRIWRLIHTTASYSYPVYLDDEDPFLQTIECRDLTRSNAVPPSVWVEIALPGEVLPPFDPYNDVLVFYNYYCAKECRPMHIHYGYHDKNSSLADLIPIFNELMEWTPDRQLILYQVHRETKVKLLDMSSTFLDCVLPVQETLLMHIVFEEKEHDLSNKLNSIYLYYQDILCRVGFAVYKYDDRYSKDYEYFEMSMESTFPELVDVLARRLNYDKMKIQIFSNRCNSPEPIPSSSTETLKSIFEFVYNKQIHLLYKLHTVDVIDVETKHHFNFKWLSIDMKKQKMFTLYLPDDETIEGILAAAKKMITSEETHGSGISRILRVSEDQLSVVTDVTEIYSHIREKAESRLPKPSYFRIEEIPKGDEILHENERCVPVLQTRYHIQSKPASHPFMFKIDMNESWQCIKERLRLRLNVSEKSWTDYSPSASTSADWDLDIDDAKCFNDIVQDPAETITICLNKMRIATKPKGSSHKFSMFKSSLC